MMKKINKNDGKNLSEPRFEPEILRSKNYRSADWAIEAMRKRYKICYYIYVIENVTVFPPSLYSHERMEGIPLFFLSSIYIYLRISRNREIIHIRFWPGTPESNQRPITC